MTQKLAVVWLALVLVGATTVAGAERGPEVPQALAELVRPSKEGISLVRVNWDAARSHPVIRRMLEMEEGGTYDDFDVLTFLFKDVVQKVHELRLDEARIQEIWIAKSSLEAREARIVWVRTDLEAEALLSALTEAGWQLLPGSDRRFGTPYDPERDVYMAKRLKEATPEERKRVLLEHLLNSDRARVLEGGWIALGDSRAHLRSGPLRALFDGDTGQEPGFPFERLAEVDDAFFVMAVDLPGNDGDERKVPAAAEDTKAVDVNDLKALYRRRKELQHAPDTSILRRAGDFELAVSEVDGGLAIDAEFHRPGGGTEGSESIAKAALAVSALAVVHVGVDLAEDYERAYVNVTDGEVRVSTVLGEANLMDALEAQDAFKKELIEIDRRMDEIREENLRQRKEQESGS